MISVKNQLPDIYYDASRDFQILGHLYEVVLNYVKTNADMLYLLPNGIEEDTRATELLATTLGFKLRRNYDKEQLAALVSIFPQLLKIKGTKRAVELAGNALVKASGVPGAFTCEIENHVLTIKIPIELSDITLFLDLLPYILPFGLRTSIVRTTAIPQKASLPVGAASVARIALSSSEAKTENGVARFFPHPLGLAKISGTSEDDLSVDYGYKYIDSKGNLLAHSYNFINPENSNAIAGLFGTSPIIAFDPESNSSIKTTADTEEN
jgi:hypothetical protein